MWTSKDITLSYNLSKWNSTYVYFQYTVWYKYLVYPTQQLAWSITEWINIPRNLTCLKKNETGFLLNSSGHKAAKYIKYNTFSQRFQKAEILNPWFFNSKIENVDFWVSFKDKPLKVIFMFYIVVIQNLYRISEQVLIVKIPSFNSHNVHIYKWFEG